MGTQLTELIEKAVNCLEMIGLNPQTIADYRYRAFEPIAKRLLLLTNIEAKDIQIQEAFFTMQYQNEIISRQTYNGGYEEFAFSVKFWKLAHFPGRYSARMKRSYFLANLKQRFHRTWKNKPAATREKVVSNQFAGDSYNPYPHARNQSQRLSQFIYAISLCKFQKLVPRAWMMLFLP